MTPGSLVLPVEPCAGADPRLSVYDAIQLATLASVVVRLELEGITVLCQPGICPAMLWQRFTQAQARGVRLVT